MLLRVVFFVLIAGGLFTWHTYLLYKNLAIERRKVVYEIYQLYNGTDDTMQEALLKTCIDGNGEFSYAKAEKGKK